MPVLSVFGHCHRRTPTCSFLVFVFLLLELTFTASDDDLPSPLVYLSLTERLISILSLWSNRIVSLFSVS